MYIGQPGRMIGVRCPTAQRVTSAERHSFATTLGGVVKAQVGPVGRRTWDVGLGQLTTPSEVGVLAEFLGGAWGPGPFWFIPVDAPVVNLLPPGPASCDPSSLTVSSGGQLLGSPPLDLGADGVAARAVWKTQGSTVTFGRPIPVISGKPVTGSVWLAGGGNVRLTFLDAHGATISTVTSPALTRDYDRISVTENPPHGAVTVHLSVTPGSTHAARPAVTWTDGPFEWGDGQGCERAVLLGGSRGVTKAWDQPKTGRWSDVSFVVQEVG